MKKTTIAILTCVASATFGFAASNSFTDGQIFDENETYEPIFKGGNFNGFYATETDDFNQDGFGDFVGVRSWKGNLTLLVLLNNQSGGFELVFESHVSSGDWWTLSTEDFNNDGFPDILYVCDSPPLIYINQLGPATACASDLNDDGTTDVTDLLFVVSEWGLCE